MRRIRFFLILFFLTNSGFLCAETNPDCLNHLGGASFGVSCFNGLAMDLDYKSDQISKKILSFIPKKNPDRSVFLNYLSNEKEMRKFCSLQKNTYANWVFERGGEKSRYYDYDVVYYECLYNQAKEKNRFLQQLYERF